MGAGWRKCKVRGAKGCGVRRGAGSKCVVVRSAELPPSLKRTAVALAEAVSSASVSSAKCWIYTV